MFGYSNLGDWTSWTCGLVGYMRTAQNYEKKQATWKGEEEWHWGIEICCQDLKWTELGYDHVELWVSVWHVWNGLLGNRYSACMSAAV